MTQRYRYLLFLNHKNKYYVEIVKGVIFKYKGIPFFIYRNIPSSVYYEAACRRSGLRVDTVQGRTVNDAKKSLKHFVDNKGTKYIDKKEKKCLKIVKSSLFTKARQKIKRMNTEEFKLFEDKVNGRI